MAVSTANTQAKPTQVGLFFYLYFLYQTMESYSSGNYTYKKHLRKTLNSIKYNLILQEYKWLNTGMKNFVDDELII